MTIISLLVILIVVGILLWAVNSFVPMDPKVKQIFNAVVIIALVLWLIFSFLLPMAGLGNARIGK